MSSNLLLATAPPWTWQWHPFALGLLTAATLVYAAAVRLSRIRGSELDREHISRRQTFSFAAAIFLLFLTLGWPVEDLAQRWSLLARMIQQVLLLLITPPLLLLSLPRWIYTHASRNRFVDAIFLRLTNPLAATVIFFGAAVGSLLPWVVKSQASSEFLHLVVDCTLLLAGAVMWLPVLRLFPGARQLSTGGRIGYLFLQSLLPNFPALIFIFAQHPLYGIYASHAGQLGFSALADQQLAGAFAKIMGILVLWGTAAAVWVRSEREEREGRDPDPLTWDDVERELVRAKRRPKRKMDLR